jgi:exonuclease SbcC
MIKPQLESISISDFRSVRGTITLPLAAPVVLIHGANGAGKTSVLSAIELALSGEVAAMRRTDSDYLSHLPYRGSNGGRIVLSVADGPGESRKGIDMKVTVNGAQGAPLLDPATARFFEERCYLAQSTLGRLLEIYQHADTERESPLTRFVKDLLGLDDLDALIDGLNPAEDIRRTRRLVPEYREAEDAREALKKKLAEATRSVAAREEHATAMRASMHEKLAALPIVDGYTLPTVRDTTAVEAFLSRGAEEEELIELARCRRELAGLRAQWEPISVDPAAADRSAAEEEERAAREAVNQWRQVSGQLLETVIDSLRAIFPDLPSLASTDPETALTTAASRVETELHRCQQLVAQDDAATATVAQLDQNIDRSRARISILDVQVSELAGDAEGLSRALAALVPHIHGEDCPVCGRSFSEVSPEPLVSRVSAQVARLTERAGRLQALAKERSDATELLAATERDRDAMARRQLPQEVRVDLKARAADLDDARRKLEALTEPARVGVAILRRESAARSRLAELRDSDRRATDVRRSVAEVCAALRQPALDDAEHLTDTLVRLERHVLAEEARITAVQRSRQDLLSQWRTLQQLETEVDDVRSLIARDRLTLDGLEQALGVAEQRRIEAKGLAIAAKEARTAIVSRVFNDSLNAIWRNLFVRLAPTEPFVPAFKLPETTVDAVMAALETQHRSGGRGGAPGAMLSAGNLNTAALTLFLALHLAVEARLPWLILDDPVQSMDEVHIAQFAALLRTLSKGHGRQILIAVHDRPLFDYLALELSPSFQDDQLITIELSRSPSGTTMAEPTFRRWEPDNVEVEDHAR